MEVNDVFAKAPLSSLNLANAFDSKICAGNAKDPSGLRRIDFKGPKPAGKAGGGVIDTTKFTYV